MEIRICNGANVLDHCTIMPGVTVAERVAWLAWLVQPCGWGCLLEGLGYIKATNTHTFAGSRVGAKSFTYSFALWE